LKAGKVNRKKLLIFDFDGTIADTMMVGLDIANEMAEKYRFKKVNRKELVFYRSQKSQDALRSIGINFIKLPLIVRDFKKRLKQQIERLPPIDGMIDVLKELKYNGWELGILTSNSLENVTFFLDTHEITEVFSFVRCKKNLFRKETALKAIHKNTGYPYEEMLYIADETRDIEAAKKRGIKIISVSWGMNSKEALSKFNPDYLVGTPAELSTLLSREVMVK